MRGAPLAGSGAQIANARSWRLSPKRAAATHPWLEPAGSWGLSPLRAAGVLPRWFGALFALGLTWVCAAGSGFAAEATASTGEPQRLTSPQPTPAGLAQSDWESIRAAYQAGRPGPVAQQAYLKAHQVGPNDQFGFAVAVSGDTVVVGAKLEESSTTGVNSKADEKAGFAGAAYVFVRRGTIWTQQAYLKASQVNSGDNFGVSVAVSGDTVVVGAMNEDSSTLGVNSAADEAASEAGAAYVFVRHGTNWTQQAYLKAHQVTAGDGFGQAVAVSGDTVIIGAHGEDGGATGANATPDENAADSGAAYVFTRDGTTWTQQAYLKPNTVTSRLGFGWSVAISGDTAVIGAPGDDRDRGGMDRIGNEGLPFAGAAFVFTRSGAVWTQQAYLKAHQVSANDQFGYSVAVSGDTVVVGAQGEDSSSTRVNSAANESAADAGAAYVFVRSGTIWAQQAYLKAQQVNAGDLFGLSVGISGDTVVVGSHFEDSGTSAINAHPDESVANAGAAYVFARQGSMWSQQAYLKATRVNPYDQFGVSVAVADRTVVVGAYGEDGLVAGVDSAPETVKAVGAIGAGAAYVFAGMGPAALRAVVTPAGTDWASREPARHWRALASSRDGQRLLAAVNGGRLQVSADAGATWTPRETERAWLAVASSADGSRLLAAVDSGPLFRSADSGVTWIECAPLRAWSGLASSADGLRLAAVADGAPIQLSTNAGVSWTAADKGRFWKGIAMTDSGQTLAAIVEDGPVLVSTDGGGTWTPRAEAKSWTSVAASADGSVLAATVWDGPVLLSSDRGLSWNSWTTDRFWHAVSCSADGRQIIAAETLGRVHLSHDSGLTWTEHLANHDWAAVSWSGDGKRVAAVARDGPLFTSSSTVTPYRILVPIRGGPTQLRDFATILASGIANGPGQPRRWTVECANPDLFVSPPSLDGEGTLNFVPAGRPGLARLILTAHGGRRADLSERHTVDLDLRVSEAK